VRARVRHPPRQIRRRNAIRVTARNRGRLFIYYTYFVYIDIVGKSPRAMKNITVTVDAQTAAWVRVFAAKRGASVSRVVGEFLSERMRETRGYDEAMRRFFSHKPLQFEWRGGHPATRAEIYEGAAVREDPIPPELGK
jgi:hypothetical protein